MAKPKKPSPLKQKPTAKKKPSPKKKPAKAKPSKPVKKVSAQKKNAAKKHVAKPAVKKKTVKVNKVKKPIVKKEPEQKPSAKKLAADKHAPAKSAKPAKAAKPARATDEDKALKAGKKQPAPVQGKTAAKPAKELKVARETGKDKGEAQPQTGNKRDELRNRFLVDHKKAYKPVAFTLDEAREIAKQHAAVAKKSGEDESASAKTSVQSKANAAKLAKAAAPTHVKAASLADILGFNPKRAKPAIFAPVESVPEKYRRYYKLLLDLRSSLTEGLTLHSEETLRRSTKDDAGDLSSYGQHMADAGTDTFDRDFALSMVANEQEALTEIDAAIKRIQNGTYGICEITQKPIAKDRLLAVPFTRYSAEAQKDLERNRMRVRTAAGLFGGEIGDEGSRVDDSGGGEE